MPSAGVANNSKTKSLSSTDSSSKARLAQQQQQEQQQLQQQQDYKLNTFYKTLGIEELNALRGKFASGRAAIHGLVGQDSLEEHSSLISSTMAPPTAQQQQQQPAKDSSSDSASGGGAGGIGGTDTSTERPSNSMTLDEFSSAVSSVFGGRDCREGATAMFKQMDEERRKGYVTWGDLLDLLILRMPPNSLHSSARHLNHTGFGVLSKFRPIRHARREKIQKVIGVPTGATHVYLIVSKFGHVGIYDDKFRLQRQYDVDIDTDPNADLDVSASDPGWITDGLWMENSKHAVYATSLRTMHFYDASASVHYEEYRAFGFRSIPTCVEYFYKESDPEAESLLIFGDDAGGMTTVVFKQPLNSLFSKDEVDNVQCLFWPDMSKHSDYAAITHSPSVHRDAVQGIKFLPHNNTVVTISRDPAASVVIQHIHGKFDRYVFRLGWGVRCFDYRVLPSLLHVLATGSNDKLVRIWNPVVTSRPSSVLVGHQSGINDVRILEEKRLVLSYDKTSVVKVWDLDQGSCSQTLTLQFPSFKVLGKEIEFGRPAFYVGAGTPNVVVATCCEHMTILNMKEEDEEEEEEEERKEEEEEEHEEVIVIDAGQEIQPPSSEIKYPEEEEEEERLSEGPPRYAASNNSSSIFNVTLASPRSVTHQQQQPSQTGSPGGSSASSSSSGWSAVRSTVQHRSRGRLFQQRELAEESGYAQFQIFREQRQIGEEDNDDENSINVLRVRKYSNNARMQELARDNMPFMGIAIHGLEEVTIDPDLPHTTNMRQRGVRIRTVEDLLAAKFDVGGIGGGGGAASSQLGDETSGEMMGLAVGGGVGGTLALRRPSAVVTKKVKMELASSSVAVGAGKGGRMMLGSVVAAEVKSLPMITEKSDTQSVITEASSSKD